MTDARFEDGTEQPLRLVAHEADDLQVLSALLQDAVFPASEMHFSPKAREFALLLNRFRWEDKTSANRQNRGYERVQSLLVIRDVLGVSSQGIDRNDKDMILSLLSLEFTAGEDGTGHLLLTLAGDGAIRLSVECVDLQLKDVTKPYLAPSGKAPEHDV